MKRNERITSSWGFLAQGTKAALCLLVLMLSVQTVFAQKGKESEQFIVNGYTYAIDEVTGTAVFTGNKFDKCGLKGEALNEVKYSDRNPYPEVIVVPDYVYCECTGKMLPVTKIGDGACEGSGGKAFRNTKRLIIGDNVTEIGDKSFKGFGKRDPLVYDGPAEIIFGKRVERIGQSAFDEFGDGNLNDPKGNKNTAQFKVYIQTNKRPYSNIEKDGYRQKLFEKAKGVTFYVKNEEVYQTFINLQPEDKGKGEDNNWLKFAENSEWNVKGKRRNHYNYGGFEIVSLKAGQWQTAVFPEDMDPSQVESKFGQGTLLAVMQTCTPKTLNGENMNYLVTFIPTNVVKPRIPMLIKPGSKEDVYYVGEKSYGVSDYEQNPVVKAVDKCNNMTIRMIGICNDDHLLTDGQIYFRNYGDGSMRFFMYKEGDGARVMVKRGKCIWEIVDGCGNVVTNKALDYKIDDAATAIEDVTRKPAAQDGRIYSLTGQYEGTSLENLPKGIHIMNGRKFVVK